MKTNFTLLLFLFSFQLAIGQGVANEFFGFTETINCPFDSSVEVVVPQYWKIYQTLDGK